MRERFTKRTGSHLSNMKRDVIVLRLEEHFRRLLVLMYKKETPGDTYPELSEYSDEELYRGLVRLTGDLLHVSDRNDGEKRLYFLSMDFPIGPMLSMNLVNTGIYGQVCDLLKKNGRDILKIAAYEEELASGSGGSLYGTALMEGAAALSIPGEGLFLRDCRCDFRMDPGKKAGGTHERGRLDDWERKCDVFSFVTRIGKKRIRSDVFDVELPGYLTGINRIRLFTPHTGDDSIARKGVSYVRLSRQYFLASNAAQLILHKLHGQHYDLHRMDEHVVVEIMDAQSAMIIPELIRLIVEAKAFSPEEAIKVVSRACIYSGRSPKPEEAKWAGEELRQMNSGLWTLIKRLDKHIRKTDPQEKLLDDEGNVDVDTLIGVCCRIPELCPAVNVRRSLTSDPELAEYLEELTGQDLYREPGWTTSVIRYEKDRKVLTKIRELRERKKQDLSGMFIRHPLPFPDALYDMQLAPVGTDSGQLLNALDIIRRILDVRAGGAPKQKAIFFFRAEAASSGRRDRDILALLETLQKVLEGDKKAGKYYRICLLTGLDTGKTLRLLTACDVYESPARGVMPQDTPGLLEAVSAGALAAAVPGGVSSLLRDAYGSDGICLFGKSPEERKTSARKSPGKIIDSSKEAADAVNFLISPEMTKAGNREALKRVHGELVTRDADDILADFRSYVRARNRLFDACAKPLVHGRLSITNIASAACFQADAAAETMNNTYWRI